MTKLRVKVRHATTPNDLLNNKYISLKAKGLFGYIQSKPDGWKFSIENIARQNKESLAAISSGIKELETFGYLERVKYQNQKGHWGIEYILHDTPIIENPTFENPMQENPISENHTNNSNIDLSKKDIIKTVTKKERINIDKKNNCDIDLEENKPKTNAHSPTFENSISENEIQMLEAAIGIVQANELLKNGVNKAAIQRIVKNNNVLPYMNHIDNFLALDTLTQEKDAIFYKVPLNRLISLLNKFASQLIQDKKIKEYTTYKNFWKHFSAWMKKKEALKS
jgi:hypothetical protein